MSQEIAVYFNSECPSAAAWQSAVQANGIDLQFDPSFEPSRHSGYVPCVLHGASTGFEFLFTPAEGATFTWGGDLTECAAAVAAASVLTAITGGRLYDPEEDSSIGAADVLRYARELLDQL